LKENAGQDRDEGLEFANVLNFVYVPPDDDEKILLVEFVSLGGKVFKRPHEGDWYAYFPKTEQGKGATGDTPQKAAQNLMVR